MKKFYNKTKIQNIDNLPIDKQKELVDYFYLYGYKVISKYNLSNWYWYRYQKEHNLVRPKEIINKNRRDSWKEKEDIIKQKALKSYRQKYGVDNVLKNKKYRQEGMLKKYGVSTSSQLQYVKDKMSISMKRYHNKKDIDFLINILYNNIEDKKSNIRQLKSLQLLCNEINKL